jgi:hypothetical protein
MIPLNSISLYPEGKRSRLVGDEIRKGLQGKSGEALPNTV